MRKLFLALLATLLLLPGCGSYSLSLFGDGSTEDKIEVGLYNSLKSSAIAYKELTNYLQDNHHLFEDKDKQTINEAARTYRYSYHAALDAWSTYKAFDTSDNLNVFLTEAATAIKSFSDLRALIKGSE